MSSRTGEPVQLASPRETHVFNGETYLLEKSLTCDYAIIKGMKADRLGNVVFNKSARNFNPVIATAAKCTIVEVEENVKTGDIDPNKAHLSSIYVTGLSSVKSCLSQSKC